ncbi:aromatic/alkene/methane monooxygenase hydroxylase/oxygenase subunit alpha [Effusibacillus lacus]|uniref:propane 2-monooxygenase n=1 Tax=Effusibacillus lacus TaxID=1348429 RepID=A0A292YJJ1_9BACL|nr:aromatic/alkene/methane monooxygenase hydroxylase/oxygenase subunit alpha [Effusibacillus lacus]TCS76948.1 toluene 4-monooxygenase protein A [Effusibacillus lacus]GAX91277.1 toluene monooxygenase [Effusibacillus lacus]
MPKLDRSAYYDLTRDMNWRLRYVSEKEVFPEEQVCDYGVPGEAWWEWDEPYKVTYREYVYNQSDKDSSTYSVKAAIARSKLFDQVDAGWKSAITAHYGAIALGEYLASIGEARMARFGRAAAWRNMATYGTLDEQRHGQIQLYFPYGLLGKHPQLDWAHKAYHTNEWGAIAARHLFDDMFTANDALGTAIQLTYTFETGFTNLQFLGMAADALDVGDVEFGSLISSIQTDESRHAQQGEPTLRILLRNGKKDEAQRLIDVMFWRSWKLFALLTGFSMDYYTPLEHRSMSFKEFMEEWIIKQFIDQFRDFGLERPWYWDIFLDELNWVHHADHLGVWFWRPTVWWNPDAGVSPEEREWLEAKYPGWNDNFGRHWDVIAENVRQGRIEKTLPQTLPMVCNMCQIPICTPSDPKQRHLAPYVSEHNGRRYHFCSEPCKWVFDINTERYAGHLNIVDRFLAGHIQPPTPEGAYAYMGLTPEVWGQDADNFAWAFKQSGSGKIAAV